MIHLQKTASQSVASMSELQGIAGRLRETARVLKSDMDRFIVGTVDD